MGRVSRRDFLKAVGAASGAAFVCGRAAGVMGAAPAATPPADKYVTCFYQFNNDALAALGGPGGLPNGEGYLHIFSASHAGHDPHPKTAKAVQALEAGLAETGVFHVQSSSWGAPRPSTGSG